MAKDIFKEKFSIMTNFNFRVGEGWDVHALVEGRPLIIGGVTIDYDKGLLGHSDADVLIHAVIDAMLGAAGLGDIGRHFSDADPKFKDIDSMILLGQAHKLIKDRGWLIGNIDSTIIAQAPKMSPHIPAMIGTLSKALDLSPEQLNIKAKTAEKMGPVGLGQSIEARAVVLLYLA